MAPAFAQTGSPAASSALEEEVAALFAQFHAPVVRYLLSFRIAPPDAEEIAQDVFLSLFQHLRRGKSRTNLQGWIFRVAHNAALTSRARARRHAEFFSHVPGISETAAGADAGPEDHLAALQRQRQLLAVVRALPEQDQCCLSLRAEGLRYREIADVLGISLGSVAASLEKSLSRLARAESSARGLRES